MKTTKLILGAALVLSMGAFATGGIDLSGLSGTTTQPTLENVEKKFKALKAALKKSRKLSRHEWRLVGEVEKAFKVKTTKPTLKKVEIDQPEIGDKFISYIEDESDYDIWEAMSYADEDGGVSEYCDLGEYDELYESRHYYTFSAVKKKYGSQKTIAYIMTLMIEFEVAEYDGEDTNVASCIYPFQDFAFETKLGSDGKPVEIPLH
jgi:hypothetical protein